MNQSVLLVTGVSGVGKTTVIDKYRKIHDFQYLSASTLISNASGISHSSESGERLRTSDIDENQIKLLDGFHESRDPERNCVVVDGHTVIDSPSGFIYIDPKIFQEMNATCIVTLVGSPVEILDRRKYDRSRVRPERSLEQIENYQREAILHASLISWELGIPVINIPVRNTDILDLLISQ